MSDKEHIPTLEEYIKHQYELIKDSDRLPNGMFGHWAWRLQIERQYKKYYNKERGQDGNAAVC